MRGPASPSEISGSKILGVFRVHCDALCVPIPFSATSICSINIHQCHQSTLKKFPSRCSELDKTQLEPISMTRKKIHTCAGAVKRLSEQGPAKPKSRGCVNNVKGQGSRVWAEGPALPCAPPAAFKSLHVENLGSISHADPPCLRL